MENFLSKENQTKLKSRYADALMKYWREDNIKGPMTACCLGHVAVFVPILDDKFIFGVEKERVDKTFYFGYSDCGQGRSWDENQAITEHVSKNIEDYFIEHNLKSIDQKIADIKEYLEYEHIEGDVPKMYRYPCYYEQDPNDVLINISILRKGWDTIPENSSEVSFSDARLILEALEAYRVKFDKQLHTYLKKYGAKHLSVSTYWIDR